MKEKVNNLTTMCSSGWWWWSSSYTTLEKSSLSLKSNIKPSSSRIQVSDARVIRDICRVSTFSRQSVWPDHVISIFTQVWVFIDISRHHHIKCISLQEWFSNYTPRDLIKKKIWRGCLVTTRPRDRCLGLLGEASTRPTAWAGRWWCVGVPSQIN